MAFVHHKWEKSGRHFYDAGTGQFKYESGVGEQQTWDGLKWVPYLWKAASNELQYGHRELNIEYASDKQILKQAANVLCSSFKIFVQAYVGGEWVNQPHGVPTRNIANDYPVEGRCTGYLDFPDAQLSFGAQLPYDLQVGLEVGRSDKAIFGCRLRAPVSGQMRIQVVLDNLARLPTDWEWIWARYLPFKGKEDRRVGIRVRDLEWRWTYDEAPLRDISVETNPDTTKKVTITIGPYDYIANEWLTVYPDQWGETGVSQENDDCCEGTDYGVALTGVDADGVLCGQVDWEGPNQDWDYGVRFQNVTIAASPTSVDTGTQIEYDCGYSEGSFTPICYGLEGDTPDFNTAAPSTRTRTTASISFTQPGDATSDNTVSGANFQALIKEILDTSWVSGYDLGLTFDENDAAGTDDGFQIHDYGDGVAARLTIVYTAAAGASAAITGTAQTDSIDEADIVAGGKTIIITLTDDTWIAA